MSDTPILYAFPHTTRYHPANNGFAIAHEAVRLPNRYSLKIARGVYRDLRAAGRQRGEARLAVWLLLTARASQLVVESVKL